MWVAGELITSTKLNGSEDQLESMTSEIEEARESHSTLRERLRALDSAATSSQEELRSLANSISADIENVKQSLEDYQPSLDSVVSNGYVREGTAYYTNAKGDVLFSMTGIGGGGGSGGGGGGTSNAAFTARKLDNWSAKTITVGSSCVASFTWSSIEDDIPTGDGILRVIVSGITRATRNVQQGTVNVELSSYLNEGTNTVILEITDVYDQTRRFSYSVQAIVLTIASNFDVSIPYTSSFDFICTMSGDVSSRTVHVNLDGEPLSEATVLTRSYTTTIPALSHGAHTLQVWYTSIVNEEEISSNILYFEFMYAVADNHDPIITSNFDTTSVVQYSRLNIYYRVYNPDSATTDVTIYENGVEKETVRVDATQQVYSFRADAAGVAKVRLYVNEYIYKDFSFEVTPSIVDAVAETQNLALYLTSADRNNNQANRADWSYKNVHTQFKDFTWVLDGWQQDAAGSSVLRVQGDARAIIPYKLFNEADLASKGYTIEIEFATSEVKDYEEPIITCWTDADKRGLKITPQEVTIRGAQTGISTLYKDNEHLRLTIAISPDNRLLLVYIDGIMSRAIQYASGEIFKQGVPVDITIGSNSCITDIYNIRVYSNCLTSRQIVDNWIADTQDGNEMLDRYSRNQVYNSADNITVESLRNTVAYMILTTPRLPDFKGDKISDVSGYYVDPADQTRSFSFEGCQINAQGTSSSVYYIKNIDLQFKKGFTMTSTGEHADTYALRSGSIGFNRFVLKADVASSESVNNTGLVMFYNDTCPYKTPEMEANSKVRWGIEGVPIVMFWNEVSEAHPEGYLHFMGKYNFNLPKRAPEPYGYPDGVDESWEFEQNNSANVKFQSVDFSSKVDKEGKTYYPWYDDFEARFPDDEYRDITQLRAFMSFIYSTYQEEATNSTLTSPVTYSLSNLNLLSKFDNDQYEITEGIDANGQITGALKVKFTKDTAAYRLMKFRQEFPKYAELQSALYYYLFTEMFLMIDSRAKNMFLGFHGGPADSSTLLRRKAVFEPYDMDTALGTNNSGVLMFDYSLEDSDKVSSVITGEGDEGMSNVFNAQDSVLWVNFKEAFADEISDMYASLRTGANPAWSYNKIEAFFEKHQSAWCESIFNEDALVKYIGPLANIDDNDDSTVVKTDRYLTMLQGSKKEQRKWWLSNRFRYMDSKFLTGDATNKVISLRLFNNGDLTVTTAIDMYSAVVFGQGSTPLKRRVTANEPTTYTHDSGASTQEMETSIYSADLVTDVGDLSVFLPNECNFSYASRLTRLQIGNPASTYSNGNLKTIDVKNSTMLEYIDCRNCPNLNININLEGSPRLKEAYFDNTSITGIDLAEGGEIKTLHLPGTITTLTLINLPSLKELVIPDYSNITRLMLAKVDTKIVNPVEILDKISEHAYVNLQDLDLEYDNYSQIAALYTKLDSKGGVSREYNSRSREWNYHLYDNAKNTVSGTIKVKTISGAELGKLQAWYPYITIEADEVLSTVYYYNYEGTEILGQEDGIRKNGTASGSLRPPHDPDQRYVYTFIGWSRNKESNTADANALRNIYGDRNVYAAYSVTYQMYNVGFYKKGGIEPNTYSDYEGWRLAYGSRYNYSVPTATFVESDSLSAEDFVFVEWRTSEEEGSIVFTDNMVITQNCTFHPVWHDTRTKLTQQLNDTLLSLIDNSITNIGDYVFYNVSKLARIELQADAGVTIGRYAFANSSGITSLLLNYPDIRDGAFEATVFNTSLTLDNATIGDVAFQRSSGNTCTIKNSTLGRNCFANSSWQQIILENCVLGVNAFMRIDTAAESISVKDSTIDVMSFGDISVPIRVSGNGTEFVANENDEPCTFNNVIINTTTIPAFPSNVYVGSRIHNFGGAFYVPDSMLTQYKAATNWCEFADRIFANSKYPVSDYSTITDSWDTIVQNISNGSYSTKYKVGDYKLVTLTVGESTYTSYAYLLAKDTDKMDSGGIAKTTWLLLQNPFTTPFADTAKVFTTRSAANYTYTDTDRRAEYNNTWPSYFPTAIQNHLVTVTKQTRGIANGQETFSSSVEKIWPISVYELQLRTDDNYTGVTYPNVLPDLASYSNTLGGTGLRSWTRTRDFGLTSSEETFIVHVYDIVALNNLASYFQVANDNVTRTGEAPFMCFCLN